MVVELRTVNGTLSNNNLTVLGAGYANSIATKGVSSGRYYLEINIDGGNSFLVGVAKDTVSLTSNLFTNVDCRWYFFSGEISPPRSTYGETIAIGDIIGMYIDMESGTLEYYKNGVSQGIAFSNLKELGTVYPMLSRGSGSGSATYTINFGASEFQYVPDNLGPNTMSYDESKTLVAMNKSFIYNKGNYYKITPYKNKVEGKNLVPEMTSDNLPEGLVIYSSQQSSNTAFKAFSSSGYWTAEGGVNQYIGYEFTEEVRIGSYIIDSALSSGARAPKTFSLQYQDNVTNDWINIHSVNNETNWSDYVKTYTIPIENTVMAKNYRLYIEEGNNDTYITINRLQLISQLQPEVNSELVLVSSELPNKDLFLSQGMDELIPLTQRKITKLNPQAMTLDNQFIGEGALYRKNIDLIKHFDLKYITTEKRNN